MKIALYKDVRFGYETVSCSPGLEDSREFVRVSEFVDVEFPPLSRNNIDAELAAIEVARQALEKKHDLDLAKLDGRKAALQAMEPA